MQQFLTIMKTISQELNIPEKYVSAVISLLEGGATIPFIARYRKEQSGNLDEVAVQAIRDTLKKRLELQKRRETVLNTIKEQGKLTDELKGKIFAAESIPELEDLYLPYRPKKKTRASKAREMGLEPLAKLIFKEKAGNEEKEAEKYINIEKGINSPADALQGAMDIIAEWIAEDAGIRKKLRQLFFTVSTIYSQVKKGKEKEGEKYQSYFQFQEPAPKAPSHHILALFRGEREDFLSLKIYPEENRALDLLRNRFLHPESSPYKADALKDSYQRLLRPSLETEIRKELKKKADRKAIDVFSRNMRELLLAPPLGPKRILGLDPGLRTGCKIVCLDAQGNLKETAAVYPLAPHNKRKEAEEVLSDLVSRYSIEAVAVGNGTGGREAADFIKSCAFSEEVPVLLINESGASVYSASPSARKEFPDHDLTLRGAVSIGRRLMDPLAELVKIEPKSIGVGQYQHDVDQKLLKEALNDAVVSCVNSVGVDLNTASMELLQYVSGLSAKLAENIIQYRLKNGPFPDRQELYKVPGMGPKSFEQAAGFLRIKKGSNPLDGSAVHPERYDLVEKMAEDAGVSLAELVGNKELAVKLNPEKYCTEEAGMPTLLDIIEELKKPGRDPRKSFELFRYAEGINSIEDLKEGIILPGIITNITDFGAFVDIGVHQDGLIHISEITDSFVKSPHDFLSISQKVQVKVIGIDIPRKRISLSMKAVS